MEQTDNYNIDLYGQMIPSFKKIKELEQSVKSSEANIEQFASKIGNNMSRTASSAVLGTGIGLYILGKYDQAIEKLARADDCKEKFYYTALAQSCRGDYDKAVENLEAAAKAGADKLLVNLRKADVYCKAGNYEGAQKQMKECSNFQGVSADYHYQQGRILEKQGEYAQAVENYQKAMELNPDHVDALFHLAYRCDLSGDEEAAIDYYKRAVSKRPVHVNALLNLAVLYEDLQKFDKALNCVNKVLKYHPNHHRAILFKKDVESSMTMYYDEEKEKRRSRKSQILETPISDFELSVRSRNCLRKMNIFTIGDLLSTTEAELLSYKNFGETSLREIKLILQGRSLQLGQSITESVTEPDQQVEQEQEAEGVLSKSVDDINLSVRSRKALAKLNIRNLGDLTRKTEAELLGCKNFGVTSLGEIKKAMSDFGLSLRTLE